MRALPCMLLSAGLSGEAGRLFAPYLPAVESAGAISRLGVARAAALRSSEPAVSA